MQTNYGGLHILLFELDKCYQINLAASVPAWTPGPPLTEPRYCGQMVSLNGKVWSLPRLPVPAMT